MESTASSAAAASSPAPDTSISTYFRTAYGTRRENSVTIRSLSAHFHGKEELQNDETSPRDSMLRRIVRPAASTRPQTRQPRAAHRGGATVASSRWRAHQP